MKRPGTCYEQARGWPHLSERHDGMNHNPKHRPKVSRGVRRSVYERDNWSCHYCGLTFDPGQTWNPTSPAPYMRHERLDYVFLELDHVHPRHHGGANTADNLVAACSPCNRKKSFNLPEVSNA